MASSRLLDSCISKNSPVTVLSQFLEKVNNCLKGYWSPRNGNQRSSHSEGASTNQLGISGLNFVAVAQLQERHYCRSNVSSLNRWQWILPKPLWSLTVDITIGRRSHNCLSDIKENKYLFWIRLYIIGILLCHNIWRNSGRQLYNNF